MLTEKVPDPFIPFSTAPPSRFVHLFPDSLQGKSPKVLLNGDAWWDIWKSAKSDHVDNTGIPIPKRK